jgi:hypothetical protein
MDDGEEEESVVVLSPIANPLAKDKLVKKILKLVKAGELCRLAYSPLHCARVPLVGLTFCLMCSVQGQDSTERSQGGGQGCT